MQQNNRKNNHGKQKKLKRISPNRIDYMGDAKQMAIRANSVFRDMKYGRYSTNNISEFANHDFVMACQSVATENANEHYMIYYALSATYGNTGMDKAMALINRELMTYQTWNYIAKTMASILNTGDVGIAYGLIYQLANNRNIRL